MLHALRDCAWVKAVWVQLGVETTNQAFWMTDLQKWLNINRKVNSSYLTGKPVENDLSICSVEYMEEQEQFRF